MNKQCNSVIIWVLGLSRINSGLYVYTWLHSNPKANSTLKYFNELSTAGVGNSLKYSSAELTRISVELSYEFAPNSRKTIRRINPALESWLDRLNTPMWETRVMLRPTRKPWEAVLGLILSRSACLMDIYRYCVGWYIAVIVPGTMLSECQNKKKWKRVWLAYCYIMSW